MPRKHLIANKTNQKQQSQAKIWQKLAKEIKAAAKVGGPNPDANPRLKAAINKALDNNLSKDSIDRNINGANKDSSQLSQVEFECYGPNGIQIIVGALTDNINRTIANLNGYLAKFHGEIAKQNSVKVFFNKLGYILILKNENINYDKILEMILDYDVVDLIEHDEAYELLVNPNDFYNVKKILIDNKVNIFESEIKYISTNLIESISDEIDQKYEKFVDSCNDDDDIQWVVSNYNI